MTGLDPVIHLSATVMAEKWMGGSSPPMVDLAGHQGGEAQACSIR
jgi:hypothetical protein